MKCVVLKLIHAVWATAAAAWIAAKDFNALAAALTPKDAEAKAAAKIAEIETQKQKTEIERTSLWR